MLTDTTIYGYAYEAGIHCPDCTHERFADIPDFAVRVVSVAGVDDREGNRVTPIYSWDTDCQDDYCEDCGAPIFG